MSTTPSRSGQTHSGPSGAATRAAYEQRAPGWVSRCLTCGLTEPYGKRAIRIAATGAPRKLFWCDRCGRFRCHRVERRVSN